MDREQKYRYVKVASIGSLVLVLTLFLIVLIYQKERNTFEDLKPIEQMIGNERSKRPSPDVITHQELMHQADQLKSTDVPLDEIEATHEGEHSSFFHKKEDVVKYFFTLAMLGDSEAFFQQFDPNVVLSDFPNTDTFESDQKEALHKLTKGGKLENIRILSDRIIPEDKQIEIKVELIYEGDLRRRVTLRLVKMGDEHTDHSEYYVGSSINDLLKEIL